MLLQIVINKYLVNLTNLKKYELNATINVGFCPSEWWLRCLGHAEADVWCTHTRKRARRTQQQRVRMSHCRLHRQLHLRGRARTRTVHKPTWWRAWSAEEWAHLDNALRRPCTSHVSTGTWMWWWTDPLPVCAVCAPAAVSRKQRPSLRWQQARPNLGGRLLTRRRVTGLFVPLGAEGAAGRGSAEHGGLQSLWLARVRSQSVSWWSPRAVWSPVVSSPRPRGGAVKPPSLGPSWWSGVPGSNRAKSESMQRSFLRVKILWGRSSKEASESLRSRLYLVRRSMPTERRKVVPTRTSKSFTIAGLCLWSHEWSDTWAP